jgi:hypothetical protein
MSDKKLSATTSEVGNGVAVTPDPPIDAGSVVLRGQTVALKTDVGETFVADCARNIEGTLSDTAIRNKWGLSKEDWDALANNTPLLSAVRAEHERRVFTGECAREAAQHHFAKAPDVLNRILTDEQMPPRHRVEAARELRQAAGQGPDIEPGPKRKFTITINLGADTEVYEKWIDPRGPLLPDDGDPS